MNFLKNIFNNKSNRDWIKKGEGQLTIVQFFGFLLITIGIIYFVSFLLPNLINIFLPTEYEINSEPTAYGISLAFFTTMLGVAFAFPDLLNGPTHEPSTMRIIVFMFANVICMLLLEVGWGIDSLDDIGLDGNWLGVIAFLFGAKATQSYFENAKSFIPTPQVPPNSYDNSLSKAEISRLAANQNRDELLVKHPNIEYISDTLKNGNSVVSIYVKDNQTQTIPKELMATQKNGVVTKVPTEIIPDSGEGIPHIGQASDELSDSFSRDYFGSICCIVESETIPTFKGIVTAGHIFTHGDYFDYGGVLGVNQRRDALINSHPKAKLFFQQMKFNQDIAILKFNEEVNINDNYISFDKGFYQVSESDFNSDAHNVTIASRQNKVRDAYILDFNVSFEIHYYNSSKYVRNIILVGSSNDRTTSQTVSTGGDSGSCVYHKKTGQLIGLLLGGNKKFSFVLPIQETLSSFNFKLT